MGLAAVPADGTRHDAALRPNSLRPDGPLPARGFFREPPPKLGWPPGVQDPRPMTPRRSGCDCGLQVPAVEVGAGVPNGPRGCPCWDRLCSHWLLVPHSMGPTAAE